MAGLPEVHVFQELDSNTCGPSCLEMVYRLKGQKITTASILDDFHQGPKGEATHVPQLARHLESHGLHTKVIVSGSRAVPPTWADLPKPKLIENLKQWLTRHPKDEWLINNLHLLFFLQEGGELHSEPYTSTTLKAMIDRGSLIILCVDENYIWGHRLKTKDGKSHINDIAGKLGGHFVVVTSYEAGQFQILDPYPTSLKGREATYAVEADQLTNASLTWDPQIIEILK